MQPFQEKIAALFRESSDLKAKIAADQTCLAAIAAAVEALIKTVQNGGAVYACGNGGSAADAIHFCEELSARFKRERKGIRAMHFMDPGFLTCWANDYNYESVYRRAVETFCTPKDILVVFSTSGNSKNVLQAVAAAKELACPTIALTGRSGGKLAAAADNVVLVPSETTERIQEVHITCVHIICELLETSLAKELQTKLD